MMHLVTLLFWSVLFPLILISSALEYSNRWTVQIDGDNDEANRLGRKHGFVNNGKVIDDYYCFIHQKVLKVSNVPSAHLHKGLMSEPNVKMVEQQEMKSYKLLSFRDHSMNVLVNDPMFQDMWYINGNDGPTYNVIDVWKRNITGAGVVVAVVDDGLSPYHPEIRDNYDARASFDVVDNDAIPLPANASIPYDGHGDKCAGVIAAVLNNSYCGVGLAYKAKLGGIRLFFDKKATDDLVSKALSYARDHIDIYSNAWGPDDRGFEVAGPGLLTRHTLKRGAEMGRRGLGSIFVFAAGSGGLKDSCAFNGYVNSIYTIAVTGINKDGSIPEYGEQCAGIMAVTYSKDIYGDSSKVITATSFYRCTDSFGGSSASAAMASGLIALMLSANPYLSWRDIQHIIARTARPDPVRISESAWTKNKAGLKVNDYVGFGLMDASKMVDTALKWTTVPPKVICTIQGPLCSRLVPSRGTIEVTIDLSADNWSAFCGEQINFLEHVEVSVNLTYSRRGDLLIKLISPLGTVSNLTHYRSSDSAYKNRDLDWMLMTLHHWGENPTGLWKLTLENSQLHHDNTGILFHWTLILHGTVEDPLAQKCHVPTPVMAQTTEKSPTKEILTEMSPKSTKRITCGKRSLYKLHKYRVVRGKISERGMWPWQVAIYTIKENASSFICGGALISRLWVLTAAHCFYDSGGDFFGNPGMYRIKAGDHNLSVHETSQQEIAPEMIFAHHEFKDSSFHDGDIALIKLSRKVALNGFVKTVCLPQEGAADLAIPHTNGTVAGWGITRNLTYNESKTASLNDISKVLRHTVLKIQNDTLCSNKTEETYNLTMTFCAGDGKGGSDACKGDSGGAFVRQIRGRLFHEQWVAIGVVSWGHGCAQKGHYGYYTRIYPFIGWIKKTINDTCAKGLQINDADLHCVDINECDIRNGDCPRINGECVNTHGSYYCKCKPGFQLHESRYRSYDRIRCRWYYKTSKICRDINECSQREKGGCIHGCVNTLGSYHCTCPNGF